jgi:mannose-1-phosphate guanylyltransferase
MAGGAGTRLWPLSRRLRPKQLLRLFDGRSLLQIARERLDGLFAAENTWVITSADYIDQVAAELPDVPRENLIGEPIGRDTANAIGLAANLLARRDADGTMAVFTADHLISPQDKFAAAIEAGLTAAEQFPESLVTFGITPAEPHTGYGYLHRGEQVAPQTYRVQAFKEKPSLDVAREYVASGDYLWNSGMFAWKLPAILAALREHLPENAAKLTELAAGWSQPTTRAGFESLPKISIDFGVMEKAASVLLVEMNCRWLDLGSWLAIAATRDADHAGNAAVASNALVVDGKQNVLVAEDDHLLVTLGVDDLVIVHSADATLVCHRDHVQRIRDLVDVRRKHHGERYE